MKPSRDLIDTSHVFKLHDHFEDIHHRLSVSGVNKSPMKLKAIAATGFSLIRIRAVKAIPGLNSAIWNFSGFLGPINFRSAE